MIIKNEKILINIVLALFIVAIICCFTLYPLLDDSCYAEPIPNYVNTFTYDNFSASVANGWDADSGNSFSDLSDLPSVSNLGNWIDNTDFSSFKISDNLYNFCFYLRFNYSSYSPFDTITINGITYSRYFYAYIYGSEGSFSGELFVFSLLKSPSGVWYLGYYTYNTSYVLVEVQPPYDSVMSWYYFNFAFNSNITRVTWRTSIPLSRLNVSQSVNQLVYTAFQSKNPTFLSTATYDGAYNAGYEDAKSKYNNLTPYLPGGTEYTKIYNLGKQAGLDSANNYSFLSLFSAVIDAPIKAFIGLLDFDILGVNLKTFCLSLFTLAIFILILKIVLRGET